MIPNIPISSGVYEITYSNGVVQYKHLISTKDYNEHILPLKKERTRLNSLPTSNNINKKIKSLDFKIKELEGGFKFYEGSPFHKAIQTGILDIGSSCSDFNCLCRNRKYDIQMKKINTS
jgi:hypothetical protein